MAEELVDLEIDIDDREFLFVAKLAHENDITFNEQMNRIIEWYIQEQEHGKSND